MNQTKFLSETYEMGIIAEKYKTDIYYFWFSERNELLQIFVSYHYD